MFEALAQESLPAADEPMTLEAWAALPEDEPGELVDGLLVEEEMTNAVHEAMLARLTYILMGWAGAHGARVFGSGLKLAVRSDRGRIPDMSVYLAGAKRPPVEGPIRVPPSIVVEVVSSTPRDGRRDRIEKIDEYASFGIRWYWLVDPALETFEIFELNERGRYERIALATEGTMETIPGCEGLTLDVGALWAEAAAVRAEGEAG
ncbi:Uma2 family endonuclease [Polyangium aurulentum]|uniref:Uma2 family endonuclease n=1 Tax=Polyangium aurulentum TaxID=2567896 RepID=UPI0010AEA045|nr:Uma2 family endonuclease [Polyangium aurulentum]UQA56275.1 Uma2 family endonuclease [Polyangium aurulentum]